MIEPERAMRVVVGQVARLHRLEVLVPGDGNRFVIYPYYHESLGIFAR